PIPRGRASRRPRDGGEMRAAAARPATLLLEAERVEVDLVDVAQPVSGRAELADQLAVVEPGGQWRVAESARAGEEQVAAVRRDARREVPRARVDAMAEVHRRAPRAVAVVADEEVEGTLAPLLPGGGEDQVALV